MSAKQNMRLIGHADPGAGGVGRAGGALRCLCVVLKGEAVLGVSQSSWWSRGDIANKKGRYKHYY